MCKLLLLICISACLTGISLVDPAKIAKSHNVIWGARSSRDVLLKREIVKQIFKPLRIISTDFEFRQKPDNLPYARTITQIVITDQYTDGNVICSCVVSLIGHCEFYFILLFVNKMKSSIIFALLISAFAASAYAGNDYLWGEISDKDYLISKETVSKAFILGLSVSKKYVFKQEDNLNALTITAIKVTDKKKNGATVTLISGGPGSKGATLMFYSQPGHGIKNVVEIYGR